MNRGLAIAVRRFPVDGRFEPLFGENAPNRSESRHAIRGG